MLLVGIEVQEGMSQADQASISVSPGEWDFGSIMMGQSSAPQTFTITNSGGADLLVNSIVLSGGDSRIFSLDRGTCPNLNPTIAAGESCGISAKFSPSSGGVKSTTLKIVSNAANSPVISVPLTGTGLQPIRAGLVLDKTTYNVGDRINVVLTLQNPGGELITSKGFKDRSFEIFLHFTDPDGNVITCKLLKDTDLQDPPPAKVCVSPGGQLMSNLEPVETVEAGWVLSITIPNAHDYYLLSKGGSYSVKAVIHMRTYAGIDCTDTNFNPPVYYSLIDQWSSQGALESNIVNFTLVASTADHITINPSSSTITAGGSQSYTATGYDQNDNSLGDLTATTDFSIASNFNCTGGGCGSCTGNTCTASVAGIYTVTGTNSGSGKTATASLGVYGTTAITISAPAAYYGNNGFVTVTVNSGAGTPTGNVALSVDGGASATQALLSGSTTFTVNTPTAGDHKLHATYATQDYFYASSGNGDLFVYKSSQTITFNPLANKIYGDPAFTVGASASSGLPVSFSVLSGPATISGNVVTLTGAGTVTLRASQGGDGDWGPATPVDQSFQVTSLVPPIANPGGAYFSGVNAAITLSGCSSHDPNPGGSITKYEWDLDGDGTYETNAGSNCTLSHTWSTPYTGQIGLRVTNNFGMTSTASAYTKITVADLRPVSYPLVSYKRITRTVWEYTYQFVIKNQGNSGTTNVSAQLQNWPAQVKVIDGDVSFPDVAAGQQVTGSDTFTIQIDRSVAVQNSDLGWKLTFKDAGGTKWTLVNFPLY
jgi:hypothetical protein